MKKLAILVATLIMIGCAQQAEELDEIKTNTPEKSQTEFYASMPECDTRTYVEDNKYLRWNAGDEITVFNGNSFNSHWQFAGEDGANSGKFNEVEKGGFVTGTPLNLTANYAIYPYNEDITITESGVVSLTLPVTQAYNHTYANSFGAGANTMMAVTESTSDNFLSFKNLCGYLKLKFYGEDVTVKSITIQGNNGEKIAGGATVTMEYGGEPSITMGDDATDTIIIDCGEGVVLSSDSANPTIFWVVIPETTFEGGITITVTDTNDQTFTKATTNAVPITNNLIQPMAALEVECVPVGPANNEIWYTNGSTTEATQPYNKNVFGATILSNLYDADKACWVITLDNEVTLIGNSAFYKRSNLISISIPNSVTKIGQSAFSQCSGLEGISIPDSVTEMGLYTFSQCSNLTKASIGNGLAKIPAYAFQYCSNLTHITIPDGITEIGFMAFYYCSSIQSITMGKGVSFVDEKALIGLSSVREINISDLSAWCMIDFGGRITPSAIALSSTKIYLNGELIEGRLIIPEGTTSIGNAVFNGYKYITDVIIPNGVVTIGTNAFWGCDNLQSVTIPESTTMIYRDAFDNCDNLTNVYCKSTTPPEFQSTYPPFGQSSECSNDLKIYVPMESVDVYKTDENWDMYASKIIGYDFE